MSHTAREGRPEQAALADAAASNIRVVNQDERLLEIVKELRNTSNQFGQAAFGYRPELFMPVAKAMENIATCFQDQADELAKHIRRTVVAEDHAQ
ncbi:hypothetical protein [Acetobacter okinawensis]|uniref:Uncharacterized protein n=1 Tax=Acetobacter okinawensis TaxID=1076594 RepID=A0A252BSI4_9PROT|nr:hypothetical protein [Acetobacter okinawensis]OUJ11415.1 hypothetical protein HK26_06145 [Acetobacter okinawensis]